MRMMILGLSGWLKMQVPQSDPVRLVDTALTIIATLLAAVTWAMLRA